LHSLIYISVYTLEAICTISASYMLFRFPFKEFFWKKLILCVLLSIFSYSVRDITVINEFTIIVPLTYLASYTLFIHFVSKIRLFWASVMMITGYAFVGIVQMFVIIVFDSFGVTMTDIQGSLFYLVIAQIISAAIVFACSFLYYYRGSGFTYEFPAWRWKHLWLVLIELILVAFLLQFVLMNILALIIADIVTLAALLMLSRKMEREEKVAYELEL